IDTPMQVRQGDLVGVHYNRAAISSAIPLSNGNDGVVKEEELYDVLLVNEYNEDFTIGQDITIQMVVFRPIVYALMLYLSDGSSLTTTPMLSTITYPPKPAVLRRYGPYFITSFNLPDYDITFDQTGNMTAFLTSPYGSRFYMIVPGLSKRPGTVSLEAVGST
ncbi:unnamed protein product, partial [Owenia fusiformis]